MRTDSSAKLTLVLGGAASGKSRYAEQLAERHPGTLLYVATAQAGDAEMAARIARHRQRRGRRWVTLEEPLAMAERLGAAMAGKDAVLIDCLTLWLGNLLLHHGEHPERCWPAVEALLEVLREAEPPVIVVSNEVGSGIVPESALGRDFRDLAGAVNQRFAACAEQAWLVVAGLPIGLKGPVAGPGNAGPCSPGEKV